MTLVPWPVTEALAIDMHRAVVGAGVVFGDPDDQAGDDEAGDAAEEEVEAGESPCRSAVPISPQPMTS